MKKKLRTGSLILFILLAGITTWNFHKRASINLGREGGLLLEALPVDEIAHLVVQGPDSHVILAKKSELWVVENRFGYRADFSKISGFVETLQNARIGREFPMREDVRARLGLNDPKLTGTDRANKGIMVRLKNKAGASIANVLLGKARRLDDTGFPDSRYVTLNHSDQVYLVDTGFNDLTTAPQEWMDAPIIEAPAKEITRIECYRPGLDKPTFVFIRNETDGALVPKIYPAQQSVNETVLKKLEWAISYLPLEDILPPSIDPTTIGLQDSIRLVYYLSNGIIFRIYPCAPCAQNTPCYVKIEVDYQKKPPIDQSDIFIKAVRVLNAKLGPWIYKISEGHHSSLITDLDQLKK